MPGVAIVTGASRGIGRALALGLLAAGYRVVGTGRAGGAADLAKLADAAADARDRFLALTGDIASEAECEAIVRRTEAHFGGIDALVNNAGLGMNLYGPHVAEPPRIVDIPVAIVDAIVDANVNGTFLMSRAAAPALLRSAHGRIVNLSTSFPTMQRPGMLPYGPSKAAVEAMSAIWAQDFAGTRVTVNVLLPGGPVNTRMIPDADFPDRAKLIRPEALVAPLLYLLSPAADGVTGRRFVARLWDAAKPPADAARAAGRSAAW